MSCNTNCMCMYLLRIHNTATMIPIVAPIMTSSDTTTPATTPPVLLLLVFDGIEAVGIIIRSRGSGSYWPGYELVL